LGSIRKRHPSVKENPLRSSSFIRSIKQKFGNEKTKIFDTGRIRVRVGIIPKKMEEGTIAAGTVAKP